MGWKPVCVAFEKILMDYTVMIQTLLHCFKFAWIMLHVN